MANLRSWQLPRPGNPLRALLLGVLTISAAVGCARGASDDTASQVEQAAHTHSFAADSAALSITGEEAMQRSRALAAEDSMFITAITLVVHKSPTCGCCGLWVDHMRENGFEVVAVDHDDMLPVKRALGVKDQLASCHTSTIGNYVIEGHVPAADVKRLLAEEHKALGLAVPGMPRGSPGMEGPVSDKYDVVLFEANGATRIFSRY